MASRNATARRVEVAAPWWIAQDFREVVKRIIDRSGVEPYAGQNPRDFKCPACGAGTGEACRN